MRVCRARLPGVNRFAQPPANRLQASGLPHKLAERPRRKAESNLAMSLDPKATASNPSIVPQILAARPRRKPESNWGMSLDTGAIAFKSQTRYGESAVRPTPQTLDCPQGVYFALSRRRFAFKLRRVPTSWRRLRARGRICEPAPDCPSPATLIGKPEASKQLAVG